MTMKLLLYNINETKKIQPEEAKKEAGQRCNNEYQVSHFLFALELLDFKLQRNT